MSKKKEKTDAEKTKEYLDFTAKVLEFGRQQGREEAMKENRLPDGSHASWIDDERKAREPSIDGEIVVALDDDEDYIFLDEKEESAMMKIFDPEPLTGYTLLEEIRFSLYATQSELRRLERLLDTYEDVSRLQ